MSTEATPPEFAFMVGTGRCGSTLVHEVLARHPRIGFVSNLDDNVALLARAGGRWNARAYRLVPPRFTTKGRVRFAPSEAYNALDREVSPILSTPFRDLVAGDVTPWLERRVDTFFRSRRDAQAADVFLHKFTGWPRVGFLDRVFPGSRFIHVVRDGRAVACSWLQMPWWGGYEGPDHWQWGPLPPDYAEEWEASGRSFVVLAGIGWKLLLDAYERAREAVPAGAMLEVRYEDIIDEPRRWFEVMLEFLGLPWDSAFDAGFARYTFGSNRTASFARDLGADDVALLDRTLGPHLERWSYLGGGDTSDPSPSDTSEL